MAKVQFLSIYLYAVDKPTATANLAVDLSGQVHTARGLNGYEQLINY